MLFAQQNSYVNGKDGLLADTIHHGLHRPPDGILAEEAAAEAVVRVLQQHTIAGHQGGDAHPDHLPHGEVPGHNSQDQTCRGQGFNSTGKM